MAGNVLSWEAAIRKGFEPRSYSYNDVPTGEFAAILDCKIWAKKIMGINCYFTQTVSGKKIQLTVYCRHRSGAYKIEGCAIDFAACPTECIYLISVISNENKKVVFTNAKQL